MEKKQEIVAVANTSAGDYRWAITKQQKKMGREYVYEKDEGRMQGLEVDPTTLDSPWYIN